MYQKYEKLLKERKEKTADVCKATGIDPTQMSHWKHGRLNPKAETILKIAKYFDVSMDYFYRD